ncbi:MAG: DM13 domain-containing protein [Chloroflexi bacterium]|nr:DM13 domain-containing protein [Chloroflexota bacterium]
MTRKRLLFGAILLAAIIAAPIAWYLISPLFITRTVNEDFPAAQVAMQQTMSDSRADTTMQAQTSEPIPEASNDMMAQTSEPMQQASGNMQMDATAEPMVDQPADTMMPTTEPTQVPTSEPTAAQPTEAPTMQPTEVPTIQPTEAPREPKLLRAGDFHPVTHEGTGTASIYELPDGKRVLRLENFEVLNGPDLYVWLSAAPDADNARTILNNQYFELSRLKGNQGNQNYELPADLDVSAFNSVTIWCRRFSVNFATAPLK